jgi:hypothetical protein
VVGAGKAGGVKITPEHVAGAMFALVGIIAFDNPLVGIAYTLTGSVVGAVAFAAIQVAREMR